MAKDNTIIYNAEDFAKGIGRSSYTGFQEMRGLDIQSIPGVIMPGGQNSKVTGIIVTETINYMASYGSKLYGISDDYFYEISPTTAKDTGHSTAKGDGNGLIAYKNYLLLLWNLGIDGYDGTTFDNAFVTLSNGAHNSLIAQNNTLYITNGATIASLSEIAGQTFDPATGTTYTFDADALDLPDGHRATCLAELGSYILIGTDKGYIYQWDMSSSSVELPIIVGDGDSINAMITVGNITYIQAGNRSALWKTDGSSVVKIFELSESMITRNGAYSGLEVQSDGMAVLDAKIYFGVSVTASPAASGPQGIYSYDTETGAIILDKLISTENDGVDGVGLGIPSVINHFDTIYTSWYDITTSTYGVDRFSNVEYKGDEAFFITPFMQVGTKLTPRTFKSIQALCSKELDSTSDDDSIKIYYRTTQDGTWSLITTFDRTGESSFHTAFGQTTDKIQFKVILNDNVELMELRIE